MPKVEDFFIPEQAARIEAAVKAAEQSTSGEIMTVIAPRSHAYTFTFWVSAVIGIVLGSLAAWAYAKNYPFVSLELVFLIQGIGALSGGLFGTLRGVQRILVPQKRMEKSVDDAALAAFVSNGLMNTKDRTGVLIYVSALERRVEIIGDKGIHEKVGEEFWRDSAAKFSRCMAEGHPVEGLLDLIREVGEQLSSHFPRSHADIDELSNQPVRRN